MNKSKRKPRKLMSSPSRVEMFHKRVREIEKTAKLLVDEENISSLTYFKEKFPETYKELKGFGLEPTLERYIKLREYQQLSDDELVSLARSIGNENGFANTHRDHLMRRDPALYQALEERELTDKIFPNQEVEKNKLKPLPKKCLERMSGSELGRYARMFILNNGIGSLEELVEKANELYVALVRKEVVAVVLKESFGKWAGKVENK